MADNRKATPIVALTAGFKKDDRERCENAGMNHYLTKPFSVSDIQQVISRFLGTPVKKEIPAPTDRKNEGPNILAKNISGEIFNLSAIENIREVEITKHDFSTKKTQKTTDLIAEEKPIHIFVNKIFWATIQKYC